MHLWRNQGGNAQPSFTLRLTGRVSNRSGTGAVVELRAGSLRERRETTAVTPPTGTADLVFGLGARKRVDVVRVLWPSGILQAELTPGGAKGAVQITELDRKPSSCPFLFTWNGSGFEFITDFLGGGELGYRVAPGVRGRPDSDEVVRIPGDRLMPRDGRYDLRVTNELEEVLFLDSARLHVVDHPADVMVFPDEGLVSQPRAGMRLIALRGLSAPASASDDRGHDVMALVADQDFQAPDFRLTGIRGYAAPHTLTLAPREGARPDWLLLSGWTDYAYSSDNVAASQEGLQLQAPVLDAARCERHVAYDACRGSSPRGAAANGPGGPARWRAVRCTRLPHPDQHAGPLGPGAVCDGRRRRPAADAGAEAPGVDSAGERVLTRTHAGRGRPAALRVRRSVARVAVEAVRRRIHRLRARHRGARRDRRSVRRGGRRR